LCYWERRGLNQKPCVADLLLSRVGERISCGCGDFDYRAFAYWIACDKEITTLI
jgi:hypothetical protein